MVGERDVTANDLKTIAFDDVATACPYARLAQARRETPIARLETPYTPEPLIFVTRNEDVLSVAENAGLFLSSNHAQSRRFGSGYTAEADHIYENEGWPLRPALVWTDGAQHARVRRLVDKVFAPGKVSRKVPMIQGFIAELIGAFPKDAPVDFARDFSIALPTMIITRELGFGRDLIPLVQRATDYSSFATDLSATPEAATPAAKAITELQHHLVERMEALRAVPEENFLSDLVNARVDDEPALDFDELMSTAVLLLLAGSHTTSVMLNWSMYMLATRPELQARLRREPEKIPDYLEELLRYSGTVTASYRRVAEDTELLGQPVAKDSFVMIRWDSANRDETKFERPDEFDIDRPNIRRHSAFGHGKHFCIGNGLARVELRETVAAMLDAFGAIELAEPVERMPALDNCALPSLKLRLTPRA